MSAWLAFGASVVGGAVAATAALGGVVVGRRGENRRASNTDRQRQRDLKAERLRRLYEPFVEFAMLLQQVAKEKGYVVAGDTVEERDERHQRQMADGMHRVSTVIAATVIEPGTAEVRAAYAATYRACDVYLRSLNMTHGCRIRRTSTHSTSSSRQSPTVPIPSNRRCWRSSTHWRSRSNDGAGVMSMATGPAPARSRSLDTERRCQRGHTPLTPAPAGRYDAVAFCCGPKWTRPITECLECRTPSFAFHSR